MKLFELIGFEPLTSDMNLVKRTWTWSVMWPSIWSNGLEGEQVYWMTIVSSSKLVGQIIRLVVECLEQTLELLLELIEELIRQY